MSILLKQSTAATIKFGPMVDDTDGKTAETALTISQADIRLSKNGGDFAQTNNSAGATHDESGYYDVPLNTTDTNTLGRLRVAVSKSGALPVWQDFLIVTANVYDSLVGGSDKLDVNAAELGGTAQTGNDVGADVNEILTDTGTTLDTLIKDIPTVAEFEARTIAAASYFDPAADTVANVTNLTNLPTMPADWLTASGLKADAVAEIQAGLALEATLTAMKGIGWTNETLVALMTAIEAIVPGSGATAQEVWEYVTRTLTDPDSYKADVSGLALEATLTAIKGAGWTTETLAAIDVLIDAIKVKTDLIPASPAAVGSAMTLANDAITAAKISADAITEIQSGLAKSADLQDVEDKVDVIALDTTTEIPASITALSGKLDTIDNFLDTEIAAILEDTATTLPATLATIEGKVDTSDAVVDAIKLKTDNIPASPAPADEYDARLAAIQTNLDNPDQYKADVSGIPAAVWGYATRTLSSFGTLVADIWTHATRTLSAFGFTVATNSDANVTAIKNKTDNLPANPAPAGEYGTELAAIQADLNNPAQYKADVSGLALEATSQSILEDTGTTIPAAITGLNDIAVSDIMNEVVVGTYTFEQILKILAAKMAGKATGGNTTTITYRGLDDTSDVIVETVDSNGNRSAVTLTV